MRWPGPPEESSHSGMSSVAVAAGESRAFPGPQYKTSRAIRSSSEEQDNHPPPWHLCTATWKTFCFSSLEEPSWLWGPVIWGQRGVEQVCCKLKQSRGGLLRDTDTSLHIFVFWRYLGELLDDPEVAEKNIIKLWLLSLIATLLTFLSQKKYSWAPLASLGLDKSLFSTAAALYISYETMSVKNSFLRKLHRGW